MPADSNCVVFYGIRYDFPEIYDEEDLPDETNNLLNKCKEIKLDSYIANFTEGEPCILFIGKMIGNFDAVHGDFDLSLEDDQILSLMKRTRENLTKLNIPDSPKMHFQTESVPT